MKDTLKQNWDAAANAYLKAFCEKHDYDFEDARDSWVADRVGTTCFLGDCFIEFDDIRTDIDQDAPEEEFDKWYSYDLTMHELNASTINYRAWLSGAPRRSEAEIEDLLQRVAKIEEMIQALEDAIKKDNY